MGDGILALRVNSHSHNQGHQQLCTYIIMLLYFRKKSIVNLFLERFGAAHFHFLSHCASVCLPITFLPNYSVSYCPPLLNNSG